MVGRDDPQWLMGALAAQDAYRGDDPVWPLPPQPGTAFDNPWARGVAIADDYTGRETPPLSATEEPPEMGSLLGMGRAGDTARGVGQGAVKAANHAVGTASLAVSPPANPYPAGSEEAQWYDNALVDAKRGWGIATALGMVADPFGVKRSIGAPGVALGSGAFGGKIIQPAHKAPDVMGSVAAPSTYRTLAPADEIARAAAESRKGITQPQLRTLYEDLGLTGREPSELVQPSLAAQHPQGVVQAATDLKMADRAFLDTLTPAQRKDFGIKGKLPEGMIMPSAEAARPALEAFAPIKKEVTAAEKAFDTGVAAGNKPTIFDLSPQTLMRTPPVDQFPLPRVAPEATERLAPVARGGMGRLEKAAGLAPQENWGWYNLMQARDAFHDIHGPQKGEQAFQAWLDGVAGTSMVNPIDNNIRSSTWYLGKVLRGEALPQVLSLQDPVTGKMVKTMAGGPPPGYGAKSQIQHADRVLEYLTHSYDPVGNPKPISYRMNLSGNWMPRTVDTHDIRNMVGMPRALKTFGAEDSALLPKEYSYLEGVGQRAADRAGTAQAPQQAATWVGGGQYTNLKSYPAPLMEALNRRAQVTAKVYGITPEQAIHDAFSGKRALLGIGGAAVVAPTVMGGLADPSEYQQ